MFTTIRATGTALSRQAGASAPSGGRAARSFACGAAGLAAAAVLLAACSAAWSQQVSGFGFGSEPNPAELARFVSPLPDGRGLPAGSGTAQLGKAIYESTCLVCHGDRLQGGLGDRLVGGRGTLVQTDTSKGPVKTVESYWPYATTLFDYIKRSMPWQAPGTMPDDDVYAVSAYILAEAGIIEPDFVVDEKTLPRVKMPNRDGFIPDPRPEKFADVNPDDVNPINSEKDASK